MKIHLTRRGRVAAVLGAAIVALIPIAAHAANPVNHDSIAPIINASEGQFERFKPFINVQGLGCVPFPAVTADGSGYSGGLGLGGPIDGNCKSSPGQVYATLSRFGNGYQSCMYLYAYYFPKDQNYVGAGHRHDWETIAVLVKGNPARDFECASGNVTAVAYSAHGGFSCQRQDTVGNYLVGGSRPKADYILDGLQSHVFEPSTRQGGGNHALAYWLKLSQGARDTLNNTNWGKANFPLGNNVLSTISKAQNACGQ